MQCSFPSHSFGKLFLLFQSLLWVVLFLFPRGFLAVAGGELIHLQHKGFPHPIFSTRAWKTIFELQKKQNNCLHDAHSVATLPLTCRNDMLPFLTQQAKPAHAAKSLFLRSHQLSPFFKCLSVRFSTYPGFAIRRGGIYPRIPHYFGVNKLILQSAATTPLSASFAAMEEVTKQSAKPIVIFVLGGPGSGKGTQCRKLAERFQFVHISAGDCLREEQAIEGSKFGSLIDHCIKEGVIVPAEITIMLMKNKMKTMGWGSSKFLIDGFPRNQNNLEEWCAQMDDEVEVLFCLSLDCPEDILTHRLLSRGKDSGRADDNWESICKRLNTYRDETAAIISWFESIKKCKRIDGSKSKEEVWKELEPLFCNI